MCVFYCILPSQSASVIYICFGLLAICRTMLSLYSVLWAKCVCVCACVCVCVCVCVHMHVVYHFRTSLQRKEKMYKCHIALIAVPGDALTMKQVVYQN